MTKSKTTPPSLRLADAVLRLAAKRAWTEIALLDVAKLAKVPLDELQALAQAKPALVGLVLQKLGGEAAQRYKRPRGESEARERLFDVAMVWFDVLAPHKEAVRSLYQGLRDPVTLFALRGEFIAAAEWLMTLAGADQGPALTLRAGAFALALGRAIAVWLDDDADLSRTMARLDGDLTRGESLLAKL